MKKPLYFIFIIIYTFTFWIISLSFLNNQNTSVINGFSIIFLLAAFLLFLGIIISKLIFSISIKNKRLTLINHLNFQKSDLFKNIKKSIFILTLFYIISYIIIFYYNDIIFGYLPLDLGIINSCKYISKIYLLSIPTCSFELVFFEYCSFIKSYKYPVIIKTLKLITFSIIASLATNYFNFNGFLYSKLLTDLIFFIYYTHQIKNIILSCKKHL